MPAPILYGNDQTNAPDTVHFKGRITFGSSVIASYIGKGLTIARTTNGTYTITLPKLYKYTVGFSAGWFNASGAVLDCVIDTNAADTTGIITIETRSSSTPTDPTSGDILYFDLEVSGSVLAGT